jgi:RNA polymerase sigma factor (sigma-70 family)
VQEIITDQVLQECRPLAISIARRIVHDHDAAEDAVQNAFLLAWRKQGQFKGESAKVETWICRIVMNSANDVMRKRAARRHYQHTELSPKLHCSSNPERDAIQRELMDRVRTSYESMTPSMRAGLDSWLDHEPSTGMSNAEKGQRLRAMRRLRTRLRVQ